MSPVFYIHPLTFSCNSPIPIMLVLHIGSCGHFFFPLSTFDLLGYIIIFSKNWSIISICTLLLQCHIIIPPSRAPGTTIAIDTLLNSTYSLRSKIHISSTLHKILHNHICSRSAGFLVPNTLLTILYLPLNTTHLHRIDTTQPQPQVLASSSNNLFHHHL